MALVAAFRRSGATQREFSARHGMSQETLRRWLREEREEERVQAISFVEVLPTTAGAAVAVVLPNGVRLEVPDGVAARRVRELAQALC